MSQPRFPVDTPRNASPVPVPRPIPVPLPPRNDPDPETTNRQVVYFAIAGLLLLFFFLLAVSLGMRLRDSGTGAGHDRVPGANSGTNPGQGTPTVAGSASEEPQRAEEEKEEKARAEVEHKAKEEQTRREEERRRREEQETAKERAADGGSGEERETDEDTDAEESDSENGGSGLVGNQATVHFFNTQGKGRKFVFVVDRSGSMDGQPLQAAKEEIIRAFSRLDQRHEFNIIVYNDQWVKWRPDEKLVSATAENKEEATEFTAQLASQGGTNHLPSLLAALECEPEIVFFLTDGQSLTTSDLATVRAQSEGIRINVVHFSDGFGGDADVLERLATENRGQYKRIDMRDWDAL